MNLKTKIFLSIFLSSFLIVAIICATVFVTSYSTYQGLINEYNISIIRWSERLIHVAFADGEFSQIEQEVMIRELYSEDDPSPPSIYSFDFDGVITMHENPELIGKEVSHFDYVRNINM